MHNWDLLGQSGAALWWPIPILTNRKYSPIVDKKCALDRLGRSNRAQPHRFLQTGNTCQSCIKGTTSVDPAWLDRLSRLRAPLLSCFVLFVRTGIGALQIDPGDFNCARPIMHGHWDYYLLYWSVPREGSWFMWHINWEGGLCNFCVPKRGVRWTQGGGGAMSISFETEGVVNWFDKCQGGLWL